MPKASTCPNTMRAEERAPERAEAADHHHDERLDDDIDVHARHDAAHRRDQRAAEAGKERARHEHQRVELADVGAERGEHLAVVGRGADHAAGAGAAEQQPARHRQRRPERDDEQIVVRDDDAEELEPAREAWRTRDAELLRAPQHAREIAEDQHQRVGEEQLVQLLAAVEMAQQQPLDHAAEQRDRERGAEHREPEIARDRAEPLRDLPRHVGAEHVETAVREVEHAQHAEDQRQAGRHDEQEHRGGEAAQTLREQERRFHNMLSMPLGIMRQFSTRPSCCVMSTAFCRICSHQRGTNVFLKRIFGIAMLIAASGAPPL